MLHWLLSGLLLVAAAAAQSCGVKKIAHHEGNGFIVGGQEARPGSWPWQAQLFYGSSHYCGGTLINSRWVLTAAHCTEGNPTPSRYTVALGSHAKLSKDSTQRNFGLDNIVMHPSYKSRTLDYDFALLHLKSAVESNDYITPACLASSEPNGGELCYTTGWGDTRGTGSANALKQALVPIVDRATCNRVNYRNQITARMICAGYEAGGIDACQGDSGGPFVCARGSGSSAVWYVSGVTSWGYDCAHPGKPGVYANVASVYDWIQSVISNS